jgi:hypothetical protein
MKIKLMIKGKSLIMGSDEDDGYDEGPRTRPPHLRVRQTFQSNHPMENILGDIKKG